MEKPKTLESLIGVTKLHLYQVCVSEYRVLGSTFEEYDRLTRF